MRILTYIAGAMDEGRAVRSVVPRRFQLGEHAFRRLKVQGGILVGGVSVRADHIIHAGDVIAIRLPDDGAASAADVPAALPDNLPASYIRYIDEDLIIAAKGAPLATLPCAHIRTGTLREQLCAMLGADDSAFVYHPVNRLDKGTSGLLCIARHAHAQRLMTAQLHTGGFVREYLAVTEGIPRASCGVIDAPIARLGAGAKRAVREDGQRAVTHYRIEAVCSSRALVRLRLETGRTHQIRVHLSSIGCPIAGDYLYGSELPALGGRFALHSAYLSLVHPITGQRIELTEPLPDALAALLRG
ncbi:MAG: RluA family pseudouridine synthase [Clostridia bacterium]|nr:RluA family pseudouridine synthase [Clostridia bacterium]